MEVEKISDGSVRVTIPQIQIVDIKNITEQLANEEKTLVDFENAVIKEREVKQNKINVLKDVIKKAGDVGVAYTEAKVA